MTSHNLKEQVIKKLNKHVIVIPEENILKIYEAWERGEKAGDIKDKEGSITNVCRTKLLESQLVPEESFLLGVDLPYWTGNIENPNKKIMIVGIDPLRDLKSFKNAEAHILNTVTLSTPFAFHAIKEDKKNKFKFFVDSLSQDNFIYFTDIYKTFFKSGFTKQGRSYDFYSRLKDNNSVKQMLFDEIELIKPDIIITLGELTYTQLTSKKIELKRNLFKESPKKFKEVPVLALPHISGSRPNYLKSFFLENDIEIPEKLTFEFTGRSFAELVNRYLTKYM